MKFDPVIVSIAARIASGDLKEIDRQLDKTKQLDSHLLLLVKQCLIAIANVTDLENSIRKIYKKHPEISVAFKAQKKAFGFAKYVRNIMIGHTNVSLLYKAIEWKPELKWILLQNDDNANLLVNLFVLETALNTYVDDNESHLLFSGDTDLCYPPDWNRFLELLVEITRGGILFLDTLVAVTQSFLPHQPPMVSVEGLGYFATASQTTFKRITKDR